MKTYTVKTLKCPRRHLRKTLEDGKTPMIIDQNDYYEMDILPKAVYRYNSIPFNIPHHASENYRKQSKNSYKNKKILNSQSNPEEKVMLEISPHSVSTEQ